MCLLFISCNTYQRVLKSTNPDLKYLKAKEYYEKEDYYKALPLFEELITIYKGTKSIDEIYYMYAMCHYEQENYLIAAFHFKNIHDSYPLSTYAEESLYMNAFCYYKMSPDINLDQTNTEKAIDAFQLFINTYPNTDKMKECNMLMEEMRRKLEIKSFKSAELYLKTSNYKAAATSFDILLSEYPDTKDAEKAHFLIIKSYYLYAKNSIKSKQAERYNMTIKAYNNFAAKYKNSGFLKEATGYYESSIENINKLKNNNWYYEKKPNNRYFY